jgi:putative tricarboxylic transport membrane protein
MGSYSVNSILFEMYLVAITGLMAYGMVKGGIPLAPLILGLILAPIAETNYRIAVGTDSNLWLFLTKPISGLFLVCTVLSILWAYWQARRQTAFARERRKRTA